MPTYAQAWIRYVTEQERSNSAITINQKTAELLRKLLPLPCTRRVSILDLGCGTGSLLAALVDSGIAIRCYKGLDLDAKLVAYARKHAPKKVPCSFSQQDLRKNITLPAFEATDRDIKIVVMMRLLNYLDSRSASNLLAQIKLSFPTAKVLAVMPYFARSSSSLLSESSRMRSTEKPLRFRFNGFSTAQFSRKLEEYGTAFKASGFCELRMGKIYASKRNRRASYFFVWSGASKVETYQVPIAKKGTSNA